MDVRLWSRTDDSRRIRRPLGTFTSLAFFHFLIDFSLILRFSEDFFIFYIFLIFLFPFLPLENYTFLCNCVLFNVWCSKILLLLKNISWYECLLKRRRYLVAVAARKDFCIEDPSDSNVQSTCILWHVSEFGDYMQTKCIVICIPCAERVDKY